MMHCHCARHLPRHSDMSVGCPNEEEWDGAENCAESWRYARGAGYTEADWRPMLNVYYRLMAAEMGANAHKTTWRGLSTDWAMAEIHYHVSKLDWAHRHVDKRGWAEVVEFAADVGNLCAMMLDLIPERGELDLMREGAAP